ncbi:PREDICTED: pentatricopeptide repeat-containing protein At5g55840-like [Ipomoea nil]|uniref:pentatricopeptide repeat-containing protein At5g55840-like n=1 Tax=Ipomoea nil TaxID=35883 RepID=UPI000901A5D0|nr:PREDICTED: pentatricopeptide repeat-containing protein At5g55840-like [Ipomoea nil]
MRMKQTMEWALIRRGILSNTLHKPPPQVPLHPNASLEFHPLQISTHLYDSSSGSSSSCYFKPDPDHKQHSLSNSTIGSCFTFASSLNCSSVYPFLTKKDRNYSTVGALTCNGNLGKGEIDCRKELDSEIKGSYHPNFLTKIIDIIVRNEDDMECKLNLIASGLLVKSQVALKWATEIFRVLNVKGVSGLRFFRWLRSMSPEIKRSSIFCSMIIDNCGWLDDYETMAALLIEFRTENVCLARRAFQFIPVFGSNDALLTESVQRVIGVLSEAGGSCYASGIHELVEMFCSFDKFEMAKFVIEISEGKASCYDVLVNEMCRRGRLREALGIIRGMVELGVRCDAKSYNYLLSSLCKIDKMDEAFRVLEEMKGNGVLPNLQTYELFIHSFCSHEKLRRVYQLFDQMVAEGLKPQTKTHAAFVKACFSSERYDEAYKYVVDSSEKYYNSSNTVYSLIASLHMKKGDFGTALKIIIEMMEKDLKPNYAVYKRILRWLLDHGRTDIASDLKSRYAVFKLECPLNVNRNDYG